MAQSVKQPTLDLSSDLDLRVRSSSPALGSELGVRPTLKKKKKKPVGKKARSRDKANTTSGFSNCTNP